MERISFGRMQNPIRGLLHGSAALASIVAVIALILSADGPGFVSVAVIYGVALVGVFTTSTLYHCLPWSAVWKARLQRLDHTWIYALVAATCTALLVGSLDGPPVGIGISLIWGIGALGALKEFLPRTRNRWTLLTQIALGAGLVAPMVLDAEWHGAEVARPHGRRQHRLSRGHAHVDPPLAPAAAAHLFVPRGVPHHRDRGRRDPLRGGTRGDHHRLRNPAREVLSHPAPKLGSCPVQYGKARSRSGW